MSIKVTKIEPHWSYFLTIEQDVQRLARFVEFDERNFDCFSVEIAHLLLAAAAETDVVCKQICRQLDGQSKADNIGKYKAPILKRYPNIPHFAVMVPRFGLKFKPWSNWATKKDAAPFWWTANNKIKHQRHTHFHQGNVKNALNAVAGLFVMVLHLYKDQATTGALLPTPQLFRPNKAAYGGVTVGGIDAAISYVL